MNNAIQHITCPDGSPGIHISAGPGMLRRIRRLVAEHGVTVEAISKRGKVVAWGNPKPDWWGDRSTFRVATMTAGGVGRPWLRKGFVHRKNSGAPRRSLKHRRQQPHPPLVKSSRLPARPRLMIMSDGARDEMCP